MSDVIFAISLPIIFLLVMVIGFYYENREINAIKHIKDLEKSLSFINEEIIQNSSNLFYLKKLQAKHAKILEKLNKTKAKLLDYKTN